MKAATPLSEEQEREAFETLFPMPRHCVWTGRGYSATEYHAWDAHKQCDLWRGWKSRAALSAGLPKETASEPPSVRKALEEVIAATHSHVDGRDLLAELHPRNTLDIKRRVDARETWFQGDWLSNLYTAIKNARAALAAPPASPTGAAKQPSPEMKKVIEALDFIIEREDFTFAECSLAEQIVAKAKEARAAIAVLTEALAAPQVPDGAVSQEPGLTLEQKQAANVWDHVDDALAVIQLARQGKWSPYSNMACKYLELRIDMRDGGCIIKNAKGQRIDPADLRKQHSIEQWEPWPTARPPLGDWQIEAAAAAAPQVPAVQAITDAPLVQQAEAELAEMREAGDADDALEALVHLEAVRRAAPQAPADARPTAAAPAGVPSDASRLIDDLEFAVLSRAQGLPGSQEKLSEAKAAIQTALACRTSSPASAPQQLAMPMPRCHLGVECWCEESREFAQCNNWTPELEAAFEAEWAAARASSPAPLPVPADEMSPEFTDTSRAALAWVLWHHQGASSEIGTAMRFALGMGQFDELSDYQVREAKRWAELQSTHPAAPQGQQAVPAEEHSAILSLLGKCECQHCASSLAGSPAVPTGEGNAGADKANFAQAVPTSDLPPARPGEHS